MPASGPFTVLILAGRRDEPDPLLEQTGYDHKALIPVGGVPMLERVLAAVAAHEGLARVVVSTQDPRLLDAVPALAALRARVPVEHHASADSPAASVHDFLTSRSHESPVLVTTADHALLTEEMVAHFWDAACESGSDVCVAVVTASLFRERYPAMRRTFVRLGSDEFSGANLFAFRSAAAAEAARFWTRAEGNRKNPMGLAWTLGLRNLLRFLVGRLDVQTATREASRLTGAQVSLVEMPFAEAAIDVDRPEHLQAVSEIVAAGPARG